MSQNQTSTKTYGVLQTEPLVALGSGLTVVIGAFFLVLATFGVHVTQDQSGAITTLISGIIALIPLVGALIGRNFVVSPATAAKTVDAAYKAIPGVDLKPTIKVPGTSDDNTVTSPQGSVIK